MKLIMVMATTADGKIARHNTHYPDWTCSEDKRRFKALTQTAGVVIMGSRTYRTIGRPLPGRFNLVLTRQPDAFESSEQLRFTSDSPAKILQWLAERGFTSAALIGGEMINNLFAQSKLINEVVITIAPRIFGTGLSLFSCPVDMHLSLVSFERLASDHILLRYQVDYP